MIVDGWWQQATKIPSPNFNSRPANCEIDLLVIHNISLPPRQYGGGFVQKFFLNQLDASEHSYFEDIKDLKVSAHVFIERDGKATQFVSFLDRAWHAGVSNFCGRDNCNDFSIGIEMEGCDDEPYSDAQYQCLVELAALIMNTYPKVNLDRITGHSDIAPTRKTDPGAAFDWRRLRSGIEAVRNEGI